MSRLARNPINIPEDIKVTMKDNEINFEGKLGKSSTVLPVGIKVDYKDNNLPKPGRNQQWYKINNDFILVNADDNSIIRIMGF